MRKHFCIAVTTAMMVAGCAKSSGSDANGTRGEGVVSEKPGGSVLEKLGDLYQEKYSSRNCEAVLSGADVPPQLLIELKCHGRFPRNYVLECPNGENFCTQKFPNGAWATVALSSGYEQIIAHEYEKSGDLTLSESLTRRISFTSEESDVKLAE